MMRTPRLSVGVGEGVMLGVEVMVEDVVAGALGRAGPVGWALGLGRRVPRVVVVRVPVAAPLEL